MPTRHLHFANKNNASQERDDVISPFAVIVTVSCKLGFVFVEREVNRFD